MSLDVLAPRRYPWQFNGPRHSNHNIENRNFIPFNLISGRLEGFTVFNPWPPKRFDLIHAFNRIPLSATPFVIGFESHLPRVFGVEKTAYARALEKRLASKKCLGIIPISKFAYDLFIANIADDNLRSALVNKTEIRYPNLNILNIQDPLLSNPNGRFVISFVGNHFARKGGCVLIRVAQLVEKYGLPISFHIISSLQMGAGIWTDPISSEFFDPYRSAIKNLSNVFISPRSSNSDVISLFRRSHLSMLTTFGDTFGYSAIESMANWAPVIATNQGALPEFIKHRQNGILVKIPVSSSNEWLEIAATDRESTRFEELFQAEVDRLSEQAFLEIVGLFEDRTRLFEMRSNARSTAVEKFGAEGASNFWDDYYIRAYSNR